MILTNNNPKFINVWESLPKKKKSQLKGEFCYMSGNIGHITFFRKKREGTWTELEKEWWATKLEMPKEILFPSKNWKEQDQLSEKVKNQLIG